MAGSHQAEGMLRLHETRPSSRLCGIRLHGDGRGGAVLDLRPPATGVDEFSLRQRRFRSPTKPIPKTSKPGSPVAIGFRFSPCTLPQKPITMTT